VVGNSFLLLEAANCFKVGSPPAVIHGYCQDHGFNYVLSYYLKNVHQSWYSEVRP
jgi:hypothetical protein